MIKRLFYWGIFIISFIIGCQTIAAQSIIANQMTALYPQATVNHLPKSAIVIDADKGRILFAENENTPVDIASISKLMTAYIVFETMAKSGNKFESTYVKATEIDAKLSRLPGLTNSPIVPNERYSISDLMHALLLPSSNVAAIMLANHFSKGDLRQFVNQMNEKAKEFGMTQTHFTHPTGAQASYYLGMANVDGMDAKQAPTSTAKDVAILGFRILKDFPKIVDMTKLLTKQIAYTSEQPVVIKNTNLAIENNTLSFKGVNGLKTGSSAVDGYSYIFSAQQNHLPIIGVVLGVRPFANDVAKSHLYYFGNTLAHTIYQQYKMDTIVQTGIYEVGDDTITVEQPFVQLVGPNQQWDFSFEKSQLIFKESLPNLFNKPTEQVLPVLVHERPLIKKIMTGDPIIWSIIVIVVLTLASLPIFYIKSKGK